MSVTNLRRLISVEYLTVYISSSAEPARVGSAAAFIARSILAVDSWPFTRCNYVRPGGRSSNEEAPETKIFPSGMTPSWEFSLGLLIFISHLLWRYLFILSRSLLLFLSLSLSSRVYPGPEMKLRASGLSGASRPDNYVIDTLNAPWADYVNKQTRVANWVTRARRGRTGRANRRE